MNVKSDSLLNIRQLNHVDGIRQNLCEQFCRPFLLLDFARVGFPG